jgi:hypothetical protein
MPSNRGGSGSGGREFLDQVSRERKEREAGYRERALKLFPPVCGRCSREFEGKRLRELTVHHKDHNHDNNPPDGSNWELLCLYCHENEHTRFTDYARHGGTQAAPDLTPPLTHRPFANLSDLLTKKAEKR